ncbi:MAG: hypothetical protein AB7U59_13695 [Desulfovibrionaceae bacterium]
MAYTTGTCTGHLALLDALKAFLEAQGWVTKRYTTGDVYEYIAMGPGLTGADKIYIGIQTTGYKNWKLRGYTGYSSLLDFDSQPGALACTNQYCPTLLLSSSTIQYWLIADGRRTIIIAKCGTSYECAYLGLILPYAPESQISYPMFIGGCHNSYIKFYTAQEYDHFSFWNPQSSVTTGYPCYMLCGGIWIPVVNRQANGEGTSLTSLNIHPYSGCPYNEESPSYPPYPSLAFWALTKNIDGSYPLFPCRVHSGMNMTTRGIFGELAGVFAVPMNDVVSEDTISVNGDQYLIVQSSYRTTIRSYAAIKLA